MLSFLFFAAAWVACLAKSNEHYSYSPALGQGSGTPFSSKEEGSITGVKVWENPNSFITGIQLRHGTKWGHLNGRVTTSEARLDLFVGEAIIQVSGKYNPSNFIYQLIFVTNKGRSLIAGQPLQNSFNFYPKHAEAELLMLSGRFNSAGIRSLGAHWGRVYAVDPTADDAMETPNT
ncbi:unnamed protein product [Boreogadus saida]